MTATDDASPVARIEDRLDRIIRLLTALVTKDLLKKESVVALTAGGLTPKEADDILGLTRNQVSAIVYDATHAVIKPTKTTKAKAPSSGG